MSNQEKWVQELQEKGGKTYKIELTCAELEFIKDVLPGLDEFMEYVTGHFKLTCQSKSNFEFERGLERIHPDDLADKIFKQFYDEDGNYR